MTVALPDSSRFAYVALTGKDCLISDVHIDTETEIVPEDYIPRIAEAISYIDAPAGDIPNVQVDSIRSAASQGIPITDGMQLTFHTMSLPTARLIWHCPYIVLFRSEDGTVRGNDYREYAVIRLDGENAENDSPAESRIIVNREDAFEGWDAWKKGNKAGYDCVVSFAIENDTVVISTENLGLSVKSITHIPDALPGGSGVVYTALTGDQCALTNIHISRRNA